MLENRKNNLNNVLTQTYGICALVVNWLLHIQHVCSKKYERLLFSQKSKFVVIYQNKTLLKSGIEPFHRRDATCVLLPFRPDVKPRCIILFKGHEKVFLFDLKNWQGQSKYFTTKAQYLTWTILISEFLRRLKRCFRKQHWVFLEDTFKESLYSKWVDSRLLFGRFRQTRAVK